MLKKYIRLKGNTKLTFNSAEYPKYEETKRGNKSCVDLDLKIKISQSYKSFTYCYRIINGLRIISDKILIKFAHFFVKLAS